MAGLDRLGLAYSLSWLVTVAVAGASLQPLRDGVRALAVEAGRSAAAGVVPAVVALLALRVVPSEPLLQALAGGAVFALTWLVVGKAVRLAASDLPVGIRLLGRLGGR